MIEPPIDKLIEITDCKYALSCLLAKRAKQIIERNQVILEEHDERPVSQASRELYTGKIELGYED